MMRQEQKKIWVLRGEGEPLVQRGVRHALQTLRLLLIVVPEPGQERRVQRLASHILEGTALLVRTTTASRLADKGPLEAIWWPVVPGQEEVYPERRAWLDLGQPEDER
jgi:hypothetical protein